MNDSRTIADYIRCLSMLEDNTSQLYHALGDRTEAPMAKTLFLSIAQDSSKHSLILKSISESVAPSRANPEKCMENLGPTWRLIDSFRKEIKTKERMSSSELTQLTEKLQALESSFGEEYYVFVQMKNLEFMAKQINQLYSVKLDSLKNIIDSIIQDEEHHRELLATVKQLLSPAEEKKPDNTPEVKYQNPDSWIQSVPPDA